MSTPGRTVPLECLLSVCLELIYFQQDNKAEADLIGDDLFLEGFLKSLSDIETSEIHWRPIDLKFVADFFHGYRRYEELIHATMSFVFPTRDNADADRPTVLRLDYITTTIVLYFLLFRLAGVQDINLTIFKGVVEWAVAIRGDWLSKLASQVPRLGRHSSEKKVAAESGFGGLMELKVGDVIKASTKLWNLGYDDNDVPTNVPYVTEMGCMTACWCNVLDEAFVNEKLVAPLAEISGPLTAMMKEMEELRLQQVDGIKVKKPVPFSLTQPRPRKVVLPEPVSKTPKALPLPKRYQDPSMFPSFEKQLQLRKEKALERARKLHLEAEQNQFSIVQRTSEFMQRKKESSPDGKNFENGTVEQIPVNKSRVDFRGAPKMPVKKTTASVLREDALVRKRIQEEKERLEEKTTAGVLGAQSVSNDELKEYEREQQIVIQEKLRLKVQLSHEEAIMAKEEAARDRQRRAQNAKEESELLKKMTEKRLKEEEMQNKKRVDTVQSTRENVKDAKLKIMEEKKDSALAVEKEKERLRLERVKIEEEEKRRKSEIIKQIKQLLKPKQESEESSNNEPDFTSTPGYGLLTEMSIIELQERLATIKIRQLEEAELKRNQILEDKCRKQDILLSKLERVQKYKNEISYRKQDKMRSLQNTPSQNEKKVDSELAILKEKLEIARQARKKIQAGKTPSGKAIEHALPIPDKDGKTSKLQDDVNAILKTVNF